MANTRKYKVGLVQMSMGPDPEANLDVGDRATFARRRAAAPISSACRSSSVPSISASAKTCASSISPNPFRALDGHAWPRSPAKRASSIVASLFERRAPGLYHNTAVTLNPDGAIASVYRKMHIPDDPLYYEKYYFTPGDLGFQAVDTPVGRVGTLVCWDQWYPEGARLTALQGAEVLFYPTAIGWHPAEKEEFGAAQYDAWQTIQRAHAIANGVYVAGVNRVGHEQGDILRQSRSKARDSSSGAAASSPIPSAASSPRPRTTRKKSSSAKSTWRFIEETRRNWPFLRDRRIDAYAPITKRFLDPVRAWAPDGEPK